ncbi:hypothetical protein EDM55_08045 [Brevibacillus centrosporus]|nr:hypothetical protein EDM55_08045 [Brevibacillus centrosporus]
MKIVTNQTHLGIFFSLLPYHGTKWEGGKSVIYLTLVIFFGFLLVVWFVVKLLFRLDKRDSIIYDQRQLWEHYEVDLQDMRYPKKKK